MLLSLLESLKNSKRKKERASEIPEWIDRCYVIGAASSTPQEARSREKEAVQRQGPPEQALLLTEAGSWTSKKKQPRVSLVSSPSPGCGWVLHHPPSLFPPHGRQSRIQHHGQLPGGTASLYPREEGTDLDLTATCLYQKEPTSPSWPGSPLRSCPD
nr:protein CROC-4 [Vicugna pacos]